MEVTQSAIVTENSVTVMIDGNTRVVNDSHPNYARIREAVRTQQWDDIPALLDVVQAVKTFMEKVGSVTVDQEHGRFVVRYDGAEVKNYIANRIIALMKEGFDATPIINFLANVKMNPSKRAVDDLLEFLEVGNLPITSDGYILAYKNVRKDFTDIHSGKFDNSPGMVVKMARNEVDEDPNQTCSYGLHFCSQAYLPHFGGDTGRTVILKINPKDVVAFPRDYNLSKGRCCEYTVVAEHTKGIKNTAFVSAVDDSWTQSEDDWVESDDWDESDGLTHPNPKMRTAVAGTVMTVSEAAKYFGCMESSVRQRARRGHSARWVGPGLIEILIGNDKDKNLMTVQQAADQLGISPNAVRKRADRSVSVRWEYNRPGMVRLLG